MMHNRYQPTASCATDGGGEIDYEHTAPACVFHRQKENESLQIDAQVQVNMGLKDAVDQLVYMLEVVSDKLNVDMPRTRQKQEYQEYQEPRPRLTTTTNVERRGL